MKPEESGFNFERRHNLVVQQTWEDIKFSESSRNSMNSSPRHVSFLNKIKETNEYDQKEGNSDFISEKITSQLDSSKSLSSQQKSEMKRLESSPSRELNTKAKPIVKRKIKPINIDRLFDKFIEWSKEQEDMIIQLLGSFESKHLEEQRSSALDSKIYGNS